MHMGEQHPVNVSSAERLPSKRQAAVISFVLLAIRVGGAAGDFFRQDEAHRQGHMSAWQVLCLRPCHG